jgi:hypothetical protein
MSVPDFTRLSEAQVRALGNVAFGGHGAGCSPRTMDVLEKRGLIMPFTRSMGMDGFGPVLVKAWYMPTAVHIAFCAWCGDLIVEDDG